MSHASLSTRGAANGSTGLPQAHQILERTRLASPAAQDDFRGGNLTDLCSGFNRSRDILKLPFPDLVVSKRKLRLADAIACVRMKRQEANQSLGFTSRPFVLCGLPVKRPRAGQLLHEHRNGHFLLQVTGHPSYGLP
jgi:hypothetical protein